MLTFVLIIIAFFLIKFIYDSYLTDNTEKGWQEYKNSNPIKARKVENSTFETKPANKKFSVIADTLNTEILDSNGTIITLDSRSFILNDEESNKKFTFRYSTGILTITFDYEYLQKEISYTSNFNNSENLSAVDQKNIANLFVDTSRSVIQNHKRKVDTLIGKENPPVQAQTSIGSNHERYLPKSTSNEKIDFATALNLLKNKKILEIGLNKNVPIYKMEKIASQHKFTNIEADYVLYLDAHDKHTMTTAKNFFLNGEYESAVKVRPFIFIDSITADKLTDLDRINVDVTEVNGKMEIVPIVHDEKDSDVLERNYLDLDTLLEYSFTDLYKLFFNTHEYIKSNSHSPEQIELIKDVQDAIDYSITYYESIIEKLEKSIINGSKNDQEKLLNKHKDDLDEILDYDSTYDVQDSLISKRINNLLTKYHNLETKFFTTSLKFNINSRKKELVIQNLKKELIDSQMGDLAEIENEYGVIKGNVLATLEATKMITNNTELFKSEFLLHKEDLGLNELELINIIEGIARQVIREKLGINLD